MAISFNASSSSSTSLLDRLQEQQEKQNEKLASGKRINSAADDAAGLLIANRLSSTISESDQRAINARDQQSLNNIQSGQLSAISDNLQRMNELSVKAGNPLYAGSKAIQQELNNLTESTNAIAGEALGNSNFLSGLDASDPAALQAAINTASSTVNDKATTLGADTNALQSQINTYQVSSINTAAARSRIADTDYASAVSDQASNSVQSQIAVQVQRSRQQQAGLLVDTLV
ncbi:flagellin [Pokkaliibacter plantistimulans]|uniref:Flagellin n=1 Tax=Pokkaliibacter plantistimulans TaxID=1635171 RepID=A0ABX5LYG4_9GAMM|nr:flagellin [Pokkaliibacter plantistimulans]PXF30680.1 flagellin [Pokkaliibacter plantistimulans]